MGQSSPAFVQLGTFHTAGTAPKGSTRRKRSEPRLQAVKNKTQLKITIRPNLGAKQAVAVQAAEKDRRRPLENGQAQEMDDAWYETRPPG